MTLFSEKLGQLKEKIQAWGQELGFDDVRIADVDLSDAEPKLLSWLAKGFHGEMAYMEKYGVLRARPQELVSGTVRVITARMPYLPSDQNKNWRENELKRLDDVNAAVISSYARGRDYHKVLRSRLDKLAQQIAKEIGEFGYRVFTDSAPVMEVELAKKSGVGWRGKHTLLLTREAGSMFFLGEIFVDIPLPPDKEISSHCGTCSACIDVCPTKAIIAPYLLDARRCISYLTIELKGSIPLEFRPLMGNRIYGCDDCQLVCPWNKFAQLSKVPDFKVRHNLDHMDLLALFCWDSMTFEKNMQGSPILRIGYERWLRNLAVALGNALREKAKNSNDILAALEERLSYPSEMVREHILWAIAQKGTLG
jgi:epoxyqueuosine reductase